MAPDQALRQPIARRLLRIRLALALAGAGLCMPALSCAPFVEEHAGRSHATFRPHLNAFETCPVDEATYRRVVGEWLLARSGQPPALTSLALGRAVAFPWISRQIADTALGLPGWAALASGAQPARRDALAAQAIRHPALLQRLAAPFEGSSHRVVGLSFEKLLYGRADEHSSSTDAGSTRVPFDAQLWLVLAAR